MITKKVKRKQGLAGISGGAEKKTGGGGKSAEKKDRLNGSTSPFI